MPRFRPCRSVGCGQLTKDKSGYCDKHRSESWELSHVGKNAAQRGYGSAWRKLRKLVLERDCYICQVCKARGFIMPAKEVDHILQKADGGTDDPSNLQAICVSCHKIKTAKESRR